MSNMTNFMENMLAEMARGQGITLPTNWYIAGGSAAAEGSFTEIIGIGLTRAVTPRSMAKFSGTQGAGTTTASSGTSKSSSNNDPISLGTPTGTATMTHVGFIDASSGGNCWIYLPMPGGPLSITAGSPDPVQILAGALVVTLGRNGGATHYTINKLIDLILRGQAFTWPSSLFTAEFTVAPTDAGGGTELTGGAYARQEIESTQTDWSGTQAPGSTSASSGTGGRISNNNVVAYAAPTANLGTVEAHGLKDAATAGNLMFWGAEPFPKTVLNGGPALSYAPDTIGIKFA